MRKIITRFSVAISLLSICFYAQATSPLISEVYEYVPAPGQFVNTVTSCYEEGDTAEDILEKAKTKLIGNKTSFLTLGGFGGYIVVGFDHTIKNVENEYDFKVYGNAGTGSSEPGVIMVAYDANSNGIPDDKWYEIAGSEFENSIKNYEITYYRPDPADGDVKWSDNKGNQGYIHRNNYHKQASYYPIWIENDQMTFKGTKLPDNAVNEGTESVQNWVLYSFDWGYADNQPNASEYSNIKIEWAVDENGQTVDLPGVDFIKIYTGTVQEAGWVGEVSTEVAGVEDLHPDWTNIDKEKLSELSVYPNPFSEQLFLSAPTDGILRIFNITGECILTTNVHEGQNTIPTAHLPQGHYTIIIERETETNAIKAIKR